MQTRTFEEPIALARLDTQVHGFAVAIDGHRHFDAGLALRPDAAEQARQIAHFLDGDRRLLQLVGDLCNAGHGAGFIAA